MKTHQKKSDRFVEIIAATGASVSESWAGTGSRYITVCTNEDSVKIRFADHGECYCNEDISVDPDGCTMLQALEFTAKRTGIEIPARAMAAYRAAKTRADKAEAARKAKIAASQAQEQKWHDIATKHIAARDAWIAENHPDFATYTKSKKRKTRKQYDAMVYS